MAYVSTAFSLTPVFAPMIGGFLETWFGWRSNFVFMTGAGIVVVFAVLMPAVRRGLVVGGGRGGVVAVVWRTRRGQRTSRDEDAYFFRRRPAAMRRRSAFSLMKPSASAWL